MKADLSDPVDVEKWNLVWWDKHTADGSLLTGEVPIDRVIPAVGHGLGRIKWCVLPISGKVLVACDNEAGLARLIAGDYAPEVPRNTPPPQSAAPARKAEEPDPFAGLFDAPEPEPDFDLIGDPAPEPVPAPAADDEEWLI